MVHAGVATDGLHVVRYRESERDTLFDFICQSFSASDAETLIEQWDWKYGRNPFNLDGQPFVLLLKDGPQIAGMYGRLFYRVVVGGEVYVANHGCDLVIHPQYRGRRLSSLLRRRDRLDSAIHFSWQNEASHGAARRDGTAGVPIVSMVRPLPFAKTAAARTGSGGLGRAAGVVASGALRFIRRRRRPLEPGIGVELVQCFDERFDRLWERCRRAHSVMLVRDCLYLRWRFTQRPGAEYAIWAATRGSEAVGYMITRHVDRGGERWGYLVDFLVEGRSAALFELLLDAAVEGLRAAGAAAVTCRVSMPPYREMLRCGGFVRSPGGPRGYLRVRTRRVDGVLAAAADPHKWFFTMGDGDLEMSI